MCISVHTCVCIIRTFGGMRGRGVGGLNTPNKDLTRVPVSVCMCQGVRWIPVETCTGVAATSQESVASAHPPPEMPAAGSRRWERRRRSP